MNEVIIGALVDGYFAACDRLIDLPDRNDIINDVTKAYKKWTDNEPSDYYAELIQTRVDEGIKAFEEGRAILRKHSRRSGEDDASGKD